MIFVFFFILFYIFQFSRMNMYCFSNQSKNKYHLFQNKKKRPKYLRKVKLVYRERACAQPSSVLNSPPQTTPHPPVCPLPSPLPWVPEWRMETWPEQRNHFPCDLTPRWWPEPPTGLILPLILHPVSRELQTRHIYSQITESFPATFGHKNLSLQ